MGPDDHPFVCADKKLPNPNINLYAAVKEILAGGLELVDPGAREDLEYVAEHGVSAFISGRYKQLALNRTSPHRHAHARQKPLCLVQSDTGFVARSNIDVRSPRRPPRTNPYMTLSLAREPVGLWSRKRSVITLTCM